MFDKISSKLKNLTEVMFANIGGKLKAIAKVMTYLGIATSAISGLIVMFTNFLLGLIVICLGCLGSWIGSLGMYAFGHLIENTDMLVAQQGQAIYDQETQIDDTESTQSEI